MGWSVPAVPVVIALVIDQTNTDSELAPMYGLPQCWLNSSYGLYIYFLVPLAFMFLASFIAYVIVVVRFSVLAYQSRAVRNAHHEKIILSVKLFFAFGMLWIFGFLCAAFPEVAAFSCIFVFVNSLTGVLLLFVFLVNASVCQALRRLVVDKRSSKNRSSQPSGEKTGTSATASK